MVGWKSVRLGDVCRLINGRAYKQPELLEKGKYPVLRVGNFFTNRSWYFSDLELDADKYCDDGDLLYAWSASFGPRIWQGGKVIYHYHIWKTDIDLSKVEKEFLFYWFDWDKERIKTAQGAGTTMIHVTKGSMENRNLLLPPLPEQKRIVAILDEAFAGIDAAVANTKQNLANARELFESYLNAVFTRKGEGWVEKTIAEVCSLKSGTTVPKEAEKEKGDIPYVKVAAMNLEENQRQITTSTRFLQKSDISSVKIFPVGTTMFPKRGGAIATNKKRLTAVPICADLNVMGVIPGKDLVPEFLFHYFLRFDLSTIGSGSSIPQINNYDIEPLVIHYPASKAVQLKIVDDLKLLSEETQRLESIYQQKLAALAELKQSILQKAFAGELTAKVLEEAVA